MENGGDGWIRTTDRGSADPRLKPLGYVALRPTINRRYIDRNIKGQPRCLYKTEPVAWNTHCGMTRAKIRINL